MLTLDGCRARQQRFLTRLEQAGIPAALISEPRDIYYLTGLLPENKPYPYPSLLFLGPGLPSWLATGLDGGEGAVDERMVYPINVMATLNPDNHRRLCELVRAPLGRSQNLPRLGFQREGLPHSVARVAESAAAPREWVEIDEILQDLQLRKDPDEVECIRRSVRATLAGYTRAQQAIRPGVTELEVMTECQAAAQRYTGRGHFYSGDFQSGQPGGPARDRPIEQGELYIIDAWSDIDGYWCDMSRAWSVGGEPTDLQASVYEHVAGVLRAVPQMARAGRSTSDLWRELDARLREHPHLADLGLVHHGGHGVGLRVHEGPDLNRDRGGLFEVGNIFTCEPGAYTDALRQGVRLENVFHVTEAGTQVLVEYPVSIIPDPNCPLP
jgi:Xaa-Pro dipeptidase